jgi:hypothetical protein
VADEEREHAGNGAGKDREDRQAQQDAFSTHGTVRRFEIASGNHAAGRESGGR